MLIIFTVTAFAVEESSTVESSSSETISSSSENQSSSEISSESKPQENSSSEDITSTESNASTESNVSIVLPLQPVEESLKILSLPTKTVYQVGDSLDLNGIKVELITDTGDIVSPNLNELTATPTVFNSEGKIEVFVKYQKITASFEVTVNPRHIHEFKDWKVKTEPTCENIGESIGSCECGVADILLIEPLGHDWDEGEIIRKSSTISKGRIKYVCRRCKQEKRETIPKIKATLNDHIKNILKFRLTLKWWMVFAPIALIIAGYIVAIIAIFKKKEIK